MILAILGVAIPVLFALISMTWYLSARLTSQDFRLSRIEKILQLNGGEQK